MQEEKLKLLFQAVQILKNAMNWNDSDMYGVIRETVKLSNHAISGEIFCKLFMFPRSENIYPPLVTVATITPFNRLGIMFQFGTERIRSVAQLHEFSSPRED